MRVGSLAKKKVARTCCRASTSATKGATCICPVSNVKYTGRSQVEAAAEESGEPNKAVAQDDSPIPSKTL